MKWIEFCVCFVHSLFICRYIIPVSLYIHILGAWQCPMPRQTNTTKTSTCPSALSLCHCAFGVCILFRHLINAPNETKMIYGCVDSFVVVVLSDFLRVLRCVSTAWTLNSFLQTMARLWMKVCISPCANNRMLEAWMRNGCFQMHVLRSVIVHSYFLCKCHFGMSDGHSVGEWKFSRPSGFFVVVGKTHRICVQENVCVCLCCGFTLLMVTLIGFYDMTGQWRGNRYIN